MPASFHQLACKLKSTREKALDFLRSKAKSFDSSFSSFKDADEFFDDQRSFITRYLLAYVSCAVAFVLCCAVLCCICCCVVICQCPFPFALISFGFVLA